MPILIREQPFDSTVAKAIKLTFEEETKMAKQLRSERDLDMIRGKMLVAAASREELHDFLYYVSMLEDLVEEASDEDFYGTEGWRHRLGWED